MVTEVLLLFSEDVLGGTETNLFRVVQKSVSRNVRYSACFLTDPGPFTDRLSQIGVITYHLHLHHNNYISVLYRLFQIIKAGKFSCVYAFGSRVGYFALLIKLLARNYKLILGQRSADDQRSFFESRLQKFTSPMIDLYISNSEAGLKNLSALGIPSSKLLKIYNGIDLDEWSLNDCEEAKTMLGLDPCKPVVTCVANFRPMKGHRYLLYACHILQNRGIAFSLLLVGGAILEHETETAVLNQIKNFGLENCVHILGFRSDVSQILDATDIFVLPSLWEGMPNSILEAMAKGLPIIATSAGGITEIICHGENGLLVPPKDAASLSQALESLIQDPSLRSTLGNSARSSVEAKFDLDDEADQTEKALLSLLEQKK